MRLFLFFAILLLTALNCQKKQNFETFLVNRNLPSHDSIQLLSKYPEQKLYNSEVVENNTRTAFITQVASFLDNHSQRNISFDDYKCKALYKNDTLEIWLNNYNGYFGNGVLVQVFNDHFRIRDINPKALKNEVKFIETHALNQKLILNGSKFNKNDSIYGFIDYKCSIDPLVDKHFKGYFKTLIQ
ncbi:hypothetical protein F3J23_09980 [Chryseobacterium sp. Tr-659]|uniref:hypothetical protein n=1 Tax=Chryseobacterium sp. Tr-659 TaxID=2608340 RepID=UPI0014246683|nr:hypothetical protein [Chryseobacterium sp. Tr-659]NIF05775.1 hypothetical protein [Chryseobacterium sp. Tr-659]